MATEYLVYRTCCSTETTNAIMRDSELADAVLKEFDSEDHFGAVAVIKDRFLRNAESFYINENDTVITTRNRMFIKRYRNELWKACFSHGNYNILLFPRDLLAMWQVFTSRKWVCGQANTFRREHEISAIVGSENKVRTISRVCTSLASGCYSLSHDASSVLRVELREPKTAGAERAG
jgi:hypothetical protein